MVRHVGCVQKCFSWIAAIVKTHTAKFIALNQRDTLAHTCRGSGCGAARAARVDYNQVEFFFGHGFLVTAHAIDG